jgi:DNA-binding NarL/FixJ family response regulator
MDLKVDNNKRFYLGKYFGDQFLTRREVQILKEVLLGMENKQIARKFVLSLRTVESHVKNIKQKLQCYTRGDLIVTALKTGLTFAILDIDFWFDNGEQQ